MRAVFVLFLFNLSKKYYTQIIHFIEKEEQVTLNYYDKQIIAEYVTQL